MRCRHYIARAVRGDERPPMPSGHAVSRSLAEQTRPIDIHCARARVKSRRADDPVKGALLGLLLDGRRRSREETANEEKVFSWAEANSRLSSHASSNVLDPSRGPYAAIRLQGRASKHSVHEGAKEVGIVRLLIHQTSLNTQPADGISDFPSLP